MTRSIPWTLAAMSLVALALGADEPLQKIESGGVKFEVPKAWKSSKPTSRMRVAQFAVDPAEGDKDKAELVVTTFAGAAGGIDANLDRWKKQFEDKDGKPAEITHETRKGKNVEVTFAEAHGRYVAAITPGSPEKYDKTDWRLLGVIVQTPETSYFFKMVGPEKTVKNARPAFEAMIKTISVKE